MSYLAPYRGNVALDVLPSNVEDRKMTIGEGLHYASDESRDSHCQ